MQLTTEQTENVRSNLAKIVAIGEKVGDIDLGHVQVSQTSVTATFHFEKVIDPTTDGFEFINVLMGCPSRLANALRLLLGEEQVTA